MRRNDLIGISVSLLLHVGLALLLAGFHPDPDPPQPMGFVEVELGPLAEGRPDEEVSEAPRPVQEEEPVPPSPVEAETEAEPRDAETPVDLPDAQPTPDEPLPPEDEAPPADQQPEETISTPPRRQEESDASTEGEGVDGPGNEEQRSSPFQIEGLDRIQVDTPLPRYTSQVNADITVRITVAPSGRVTGVLPLRKADAALERAVRDAVLNWRFNPLPDNAPQENQSGVVTFRFRLQ